MKILFYDLENTPLLAYTWGTYKTNVLSILDSQRLLSFAYKFDDGPTHVLSRRLYTERQLVKKLWKLFDEADVVCAQNGDAFDQKVANHLFIKYGLKPPSPYKTIDTLKIAKKYFKFPSNKLDYLAEFLLGERKIETNFSLWVRCMKGEEAALKEMEKYNVHDVDILYRVYHQLKGWHTGHPNHNLYSDNTHTCPVCGGKTQRRGFMYTRTGKYQRYQCVECGAWSKGEKIKHDKVLT